MNNISNLSPHNAIQENNMKAKLALTALATMLFANTASAEDITIYSYAKTAQKPAEWAIIPVIADAPDHKVSTLFETLKKRKMPTYGNTLFDASTNIVSIDVSKCAYAPIISAEIGHTFMAHGHGTPVFTCDGRNIAPAVKGLTHFIAVVPLWQAITAEEIDEPAIVQVADTYMTPKDFKAKLKKKDKTIVKAIEAGFDDENTVVRAGLMQGYIALGFKGAEKRLAKELDSGDPTLITTAMTSLAKTKTKSIIKQMKNLLTTESPQQKSYAIILMDAADQDLQDEAMLILLRSGDDALFNRAIERLDKTKKLALVRKNMNLILPNASPVHAQTLAEKLIADDEGALEIAEWLRFAKNTETSQAVADTALKLSFDKSKLIAHDTRSTLRRAAWSLQLLSSDPKEAYDALDSLEFDATAQNTPGLWLRGLLSTLPGIQIAAGEHLEALPSSDVKLSQNLVNAFMHPKLTEHWPLLTTVHATAISDPKTALNSGTTVPELRAATMAMAITNPDEAKGSGSNALEGAYLLGIAQKTPTEALPKLTAEAYNADVRIRRDVAYATRWLDMSGDTLRTTMLKDSDETVVRTLIAQIAKIPADNATVALVKEMTERAERSAALKIAVLHALPNLLNAKTVQTISAHASNQMFDTDVNVKIAAIRALSEIARHTDDTLIVDNVITSLALTSQDQDPNIVHHTLIALAKTKNPAAAEIISRALQTHTESALKALVFYPFLTQAEIKSLLPVKK